MPLLAPMTSHVAVPPPFAPTAASASLGRELDAASSAGLHVGSDWRTTHPTASDGELESATIAAMPAPLSGAPHTAELAELHALESTRTADQSNAALWYSKHGHEDVWNDLLHEYQGTVGPEQAAAGARLFARATDLARTIGGDAKQHFGELHPYVEDATLSPITKGGHHGGGDDPSSSGAGIAAGKEPSFAYPSSHAAGSFAAAEVLASLEPARRAEFEATAREVAYSRLYAGVHYRSDVVQGAWLGALAAGVALRESAAPVASGA